MADSKPLRELATESPIHFALGATTLFAILLFGAALARSSIAGQIEQRLAEGLVRLAVGASLVCVLYRFHWLRKSGFCMPSRATWWLLVIPPVVYTGTAIVHWITGSVWRPPAADFGLLATVVCFLSAQAAQSFCARTVGRGH